MNDEAEKITTTDTPLQTKASAVTTIAWIWMFLASFSLVTSLFFLSALGSSNFSFSGQFSGGMGGMPGPFDNLMGLFQYLRPMLIFHTVMAAFVLVVAIAFLKLKPWARVAMLALNYFSLLSMVAFWVGWLGLWWKTSGEVGAPVAFVLIGGVIALSVMVVFSIPVILMVRALHGQRVRDSFVRGKPELETE